MQIRNYIKPYYFTLIIFFVCCNSFAQQYWIPQVCPTTKFLTRVAFTDSLNGWASGDSGAIVHTSNGGLNWLVQQSSIFLAIDDLFFINTMVGWALANDYTGAGTIVLRTTNGGINWTHSRYTDTSLTLKSVYFLDTLNGYLGGISPDIPVILRTTNGGVNWSKGSIHNNICFDYPILRLNFFNPQHGFACGGYFDRAGICWITTDGGFNWVDSCISAEPLFDVYPLSSNRAVLAGGDPEYGSYVYSTSNGGNSWGGMFIGISGIAQRIARRTSNEFWIPCGNIGKFAVSLDTAATWFPVDLQDSMKAFDTKFVSPFSGWSVGNRGNNFIGVILKYNASLIGIRSNQTSVPVNPVLYQNYPNPFNPATLIKYYIPSGSNVKITIFDVLGKTVKVYDEGMKSSGFHSVDFDGREFSSGVYIYRIHAYNDKRDYIENKKMVLIK